MVAVVTADGYQRLPDDEVAAVAEAVVAGRMQERPDGPPARGLRRPPWPCRSTSRPSS
jgi:hypothetical protein